MLLFPGVNGYSQLFVSDHRRAHPVKFSAKYCSTPLPLFLKATAEDRTGTRVTTYNTLDVTSSAAFFLLQLLLHLFLVLLNVTTTTTTASSHPFTHILKGAASFFRSYQINKSFKWLCFSNNTRKNPSKYQIVMILSRKKFWINVNKYLSSNLSQKMYEIFLQ